MYKTVHPTVLNSQPYPTLRYRKTKTESQHITRRHQHSEYVLNISRSTGAYLHRFQVFRRKILWRCGRVTNFNRKSPIHHESRIGTCMVYSSVLYVEIGREVIQVQQSGSSSTTDTLGPKIFCNLSRLIRQNSHGIIAKSFLDTSEIFLHRQFHLKQPIFYE